MSNFRYRLREAVKVLTLHPGSIKYRLHAAIVEHLLLANFPEDLQIPGCFRQKHRGIIDKVTTRIWGAGLEGDRVRATLHGKHGRTLSGIASEIRDLHEGFEEYLSSLPK